MNSSQRKKFIWYFHKRLESLDYCNTTFENAILDEKQDIMNTVKSGSIQPDDPEISKALNKYDYHILPTFRNCMLLGAYTFIEDVLLQFGTDAIQDFTVQVRQSSYRMSKVRRYLKVLGSQLTIDFTSINNDLRLIDDIGKIRNAITHAWGKIDNCNNPAELRRIISRRNWVEETGDGYILVRDDAYADAIDPLLELVEHILNSVPASDN
ncbi:MAG: hypothetical protein JW837_07935 [Sedimentisphaerales bacterium]|nr:hypothetical protein [Sedimentisphaerales bacterium]